LRRITLTGALFLGFVAITPALITLALSGFGINMSGQSGVLLVSSAGLLIVVGTVRDTFQII